VNIILFRSVLLVIAFGVMVGCEEEQDTERPTASLLTPLNGATVATDQGIIFRALFEDNGQLLQYKVLLEGIDSLNGIAKDTAIRWIEIGGLSGAAYELNDTIALPASMFNGHYRLLVTCVDSDGNQAYNDTIAIRVVNVADTIVPVFSVSGPTVGDTLGIGEGFPLLGQITDETSLNYVTVFIGRTNRSLTKHEFDFPIVLDNTVNLNDIGWYFPIDSTWTKGAYEVYITAWDDHNGVEFSIPFHINY
jgi:hypothetical protein